ncbi:DUF2339 domain-containing protein [Geomonas sp. RF6]|uniref:DUF2339 domain-containing protein n=1 Tax=Geomonas sp. RF6 TaxID=2897342 RepID=UPI001E43A40D|nr:DUF2339 domain-containing protein [Geomonas sp. RF6]UFS68816.1 DUF2339 domain-containing protein [Geomonas sp. RF6]
MQVLYAMAGGAIGAAFNGFSGFVFGALIGWLLADRLEMHQRFRRLEREVAWLRDDAARNVPRRAPEVVAQKAPLQTPAPHPPPEGAAAAPQEPPTAATPPAAREPAPPGAGERAPHLLPEGVLAFFTGGNLLVKTGVVILFFGVSFLVKYAAQHGLLPIELRLAASAAAGIVLLAVGWSLRGKRLEYALALQGGGIGVLYITSFAAFRLYSLFSPFAAFTLLAAISVLCGALAVLEETPTLALFGISGGFLAPLLASTGHGSHVFLFGYYAVLNAGIIGIAWFKSWRPLNLAGFIFTFVIGAFWGARYYRPDFFPTTEPFLVLFFLMYVGVAVLFALRQPPRLKGYLDGTLIFGTPVAAFALQAELVADYRYGLAWSALCAGLIYLSLASVLFRRDSALRPLAEAFAAFGGIYLTLAVPLAFDGRWTAAVWAVEGAAIAWSGIRQSRQHVRFFGIFLQFAAGLVFISEEWGSVGDTPLLNAFYLGCLLLAASGLWSGYTLYRHRERLLAWELPLNAVLLGWGLAWWLAGGWEEMGRHLPTSVLYGGRVLFVAGTSAGCHFLERRLSWHPLAFPALGMVPALYLLLFAAIGSHPCANGGWFVWPVAFALGYLILYLREGEQDEVLRLLHAAALWLLAVAATWELCWQLQERLPEAGSWLAAGYVLFPDLFLLVAAGWGGRLPWPVRRHRDWYLTLAAVPLAFWILSWIVLANLEESGDPWPFRWLPLLNVFDLAVVLSLCALLLWYRHFRELPEGVAASYQPRAMPPLYAAAVFVWLNALLARALHYWGDVPLEAGALFDSTLAQSSFAIFWALLSLCVMVVASRVGMRKFWFAGGALLAVVVLKLFVIDLAGQGTVERIVSFVAVGVLLLVIGWFSPVPPP